MTTSSNGLKNKFTSQRYSLHHTRRLLNSVNSVGIKGLSCRDLCEVFQTNGNIGNVFGENPQG